MSATQPVTPLPPDSVWLQCLGGTALVQRHADGTVAPLLGPGKATALVVYLRCAPRRSASREHVIDLFWSDAEPSAARHALRQTVWYLRQHLGDPVIEATPTDIRLTHAFPSDRDTFLDAIEHGAFEAAVEAYAGDFLPTLAIPGAAAFEHWADAERTRLRLLFARAAEEVVRECLRTGRAREGRTLVRRMRDLDPLAESGWRLFLETLIAGGDRLTALAEADRLEALLAEEGRAPEPATRTILRAVREEPRTAAPETPDTLAAELIGREVEFRVMLGAWEAARQGRRKRIHVHGVAGLGKTRLLNDVAARLRASGARTAVARASPGERDLPFALAAEVAAALGQLPGASGVAPASATALVTLNPALSSTFPAAAQHQASPDELLRVRTLAVADLLAAVSDDGPVAVVVDDLHWADAQSLQVLDGALRRTTATHLLFVTAARPTIEQPWSRDGAEELVLRPLTAEQTGAFVASLGSLPTAAWAAGFVTALHAATGGSPLLILEVLLLALDRGSLLRTEDGWACGDPERLVGALESGSALRQRVADLDRVSAWLILLLATNGRPLSTEDLAIAADHSPRDVTDRLDDLEHRGFVIRVSDSWQAAHDEIADTVVETATDAARRAAHQAIGNALADGQDQGRATMQRAARHLAAAQALGALTRLYVRWCRHAWNEGDRRGPRTLAADLLGQEPAPTLATTLIAALPLRARVGLTSRLRIAVAIAAAAGLVIVPGLALRPPTAETWVVSRVFTGTGVAEWREVAVPRTLVDGQTLDVSSGRRLGWGEYELSSVDAEGRWLARRVMADSGGDEIFMLQRGREPVRLTHSPGDDGDAQWSPDGRQILFHTGRWDERSWYDLAIMDAVTYEVRPLTRTPDAESGPRWSPDGSRIAFTRRVATADQWQACVISIDGSDQNCDISAIAVLGWIDAETIATIDEGDGPNALNAVHLTSGSRTALAEDLEFAPAGGPWVTAEGQLKDFRTTATYLLNLRNPLVRIRLTPNSLLARGWHVRPSHPNTDWIDRLSIIVPTTAPLPLTAYTHLEAVALGPKGNPVPTPFLQWRSLDPSVATVGPNGSVRPESEGTVTLVVSAGGWRSDSVAITIRPSPLSVALEEVWDSTWTDRWVPYGTPLPEVITGPGGPPAFSNNGDGSHTSGAYTSAQLNGSLGTGIDFRVLGEFTDVQWQEVRVAVFDAQDTTAVGSWDHRTGDPPFLRSAPACLVSFQPHPSQEGTVRLVLTGARTLPEAVLDTAIPDSWDRLLRLQMFPDGRCGAALDGMPIGITRTHVPPSHQMRIVLAGNSVGTRVLVGRTQIWTGVKADIDWREMEEQ